jgi:Family of unknown function (DUF6049)
VHGLLRANFTRRTLSLAAALALPAAVTAALFGTPTPARASPLRGAQAGTVSVAIDSMSPQVAGPGATITVTGTVSNGTNQAKAGLDVQLYTSPTRFLARDAMDEYASQGGIAGLVTAGNPFPVAASLRPGATVAWHASFQVNSVGMAEFGVYPVTAELTDQFGDAVASDQTLLPFWPGQQAAGLARRLDIGWIWPLIDQPHHQVCAAPTNNDLPALTSNDLAASLGRQGRLAALLAAGRAHPGANLTWVIDPALVSDVQTMTGRYQVASGSSCTGPTEPASRTAAGWLSALRAITSSQRAVITPYANVDAAALVHAGLNADLTSAYATGYQVADSALHRPIGRSIALPAGGTADLSLLACLATAEGIRTVVLDNTQMPPVSNRVFEDDAVTSITVAGRTMTVLLADHVLTGILQEGDTSSGILPQSTQFSVSQRFLAETAMIAAEAPDSDRSIVVAPPDNWSPSAALADQLLAETMSAPWLAPTSLADLARSHDTARSIARQQLPSSNPGLGELSGGYMATVSTVRSSLGKYQAMLYQPSEDYQQSLDQALAATESSAWRGSGMPQGLALAYDLSDYLSSQESKVRIIAADQVSMAGASGAVPVSIQNGLAEAIRVKVYASVVNSPGRTSQLTVGRFHDLIVVPPHTTGQLVRLPVSSAPQGSTVIRLSLTSADGTPLPVAPKSLTVLSTRYGRAILFLIGAAIGVMILASGYRGVRRWLRADTNVTSDDAGQPGSVGMGTSTARHPTEAADDLAEARRWADEP